MKKVKISLIASDWPLQKQTPNWSGIWGNYEFIFDNSCNEYDYWIVLYGLPKNEKAICPRNKIFLVDGEPKSIAVFPQHFIDQFDNLITTKSCYRHKNVIKSHTLLGWMVGAHYDNELGIYIYHDKSIDELLAGFGKIKKNKLLSVITSDKVMSDGHRKRLNFVKELQKCFGDEIDVFGRGINTFEDKWDVLAPYKYHIVLENECADDYFTEKLCDAFLAESFPIYYGCSNIYNYFKSESMCKININNTKDSIAAIRWAIENDLYNKRREYILEAKRLVLEKYNIFPSLVEILDAHDKQYKPEDKKIQILLSEHNSKKCLLIREIKRLLCMMCSR